MLCISITLFSGQLEDLAALFEESGKDVNPKLKSLVGQIITSKLDIWREVLYFNYLNAFDTIQRITDIILQQASIDGRVSLPRYVDMNWSIHVKKASSEVNYSNLYILEK